jgi:hypothetical protein
MPLSNPLIPPTLSSSTTRSTVACNASTTTELLAASTNRVGATIYNVSNKKLYVELGAAASASAYTTLIQAGGYYELPFGWQGSVNGIFDSGTGNVLVREFT